MDHASDGEEGLSPGSGGPEERSVGNVSGVALAHDLSVDHPEGARGGQPVLLVVVLLGLLCMYAANALRKPPSRGADQSPPERSVRFPWGDDTPSPGSNTSSTPTTPSPTTAAAADGMMGILHITPANPPEGRSRDSDMATPAKYSLRRSASAVKRKRGAGHS
ncbi:hypothetical protein EON64_06940 [archaeon]|nr:MAG: hypothetical protein EON64_06940 [archaeon]